MTRPLALDRRFAVPRTVGYALLAAAACSGDGASGGSGGIAPPYSTSGWGAIHADARNTDSVPFDGPADVSAAFHAVSGRIIAAAATIGPDDTVYVGVGPRLGGSTDAGCYLFAIDGITGAQRWCSSEVNGLAATSSPLIDTDGNLYHGDDRAMVSFTADGAVRWKTPIEGYPISAQFTPDGRVLFMTQIGRLYVLERATGALAMEPYATLPGVTYDPATSSPYDCFTGKADGTCYAANTPSIDFASGRFFFTLTDPAAPPTKLVAMRYVGGAAPRVEPLWENSTLEGGSASSPDISADGKRLYVNDAANHVLALDARTGAMIWSYDLGFSPLGSLCTAADGTIIPTGALDAAALALRDAGDHAELLWTSSEFGSRSIAVHAANGLAYIVGAPPGALFGLTLYVVDAASGAVLDREPIAANDAATVGSSLSRSGLLVVPALLDGLYGFHPAGAG